ncbi:hypothetical protein [Pseudomonas sp. FSL W5-0299]|uniref:hypothetical protein n=1 Tax=Pseudomonas sp. FSL W5-0299 TaxID=1917484 RepID=UPI001301D2B5|nr:hypothetical protein [Pseudomonas sp. FSL W5-0299]
MERLLHICVTHQALDVFLFETLLLVQPGAECADLVESGPLTGRHLFVGLRIVARLSE